MVTVSYLLFPAKDSKQRTENINSDYKTVAGEAKEFCGQLNLFL